MGRGSLRSLKERFICSASADEIMSSPVSGLVKHLNRGKKRKLNVDSWKKEVKKSRRNSGKEYSNYKNEVVPEKVPISEVSGTTLLVLGL